MDLSDEDNAFDWLQKRTICSFISSLSVQLNEFLQSEIKQKLSSFQKITRNTTIWGILLPTSVCSSNLIVSSAWLYFLLESTSGEKKLTNNYMLIKKFLKNVIYFLCCQGRLKYFLQNYRFCQKSWNDAYSRGGGSCYLRHNETLRTKINMWLTP